MFFCILPEIDLETDDVAGCVQLPQVGEDGPDSQCPLWDQSGRNAGFEKPEKIFRSVS